jgi:hypothetical protein
MKLTERLKPGVGKSWLYTAAGLAWSGVGLYLDYLALGWLREVNPGIALLYAAAGLLLAAAIDAIMFKRFADQNIARIRDMKNDRICIFAFQRWSSYPLVVI